MLQKLKIASCVFIVVFMTLQVFTIPAFGIQEPEDTPPMLPPRAQGQIKDALEKRVKDVRLTKRHKPRLSNFGLRFIDRTLINQN